MWTPPFINGSVASSTLFSAAAGDASGLNDGYNIGGHVNSPGTLLLAIATVTVVAKIGLDIALHILSFFLPVPRDSRALYKVLRSRYRKTRNLLGAGVQPATDGDGGAAPTSEEEEEDADMMLADSLEVDGDPIFTKALKGVLLKKVRLHKGEVVHEDNVRYNAAQWVEKAAYANPLQLIFKLAGLETERVRLTPEEWAAAKHAPAQLIGSANISYEPEYSAHYAKAYEYMAPSYVLDQAVKVFEKVPKPDDEAGAAEATEATEESDEEESNKSLSESDDDVELTIEARYALRKQRQRAGE